MVDDANPRAVVGDDRARPAAAGRRRRARRAGRRRRRRFVRGIRAALVVGAVLTLLALVVGFLVFPRGRRDERADDAEAVRLALEEDPTG